MAEYIERKKIFPNGVFFVNENDPLASIDELIKRIWSIPAADVAPVVHGSRVPAEQPKKVLLDSKCAECASLMLATDKYCPNCGARMDGE